MRLFKQLDRNRDGKLSFEEFRLGYESDSVLRPMSASRFMLTKYGTDF